MGLMSEKLADSVSTLTTDASIPASSSPETGANKVGVKKSGLWLIIVAALLWSTSGFFARAPWFNDWPAEWRGLTLAFYRALFASCLLIPFVRRISFRWEMIPMVIFFAVMNWTYLTALVQGPPTNAIWLQNTAPVWVLLVGVFFMNEPLRRSDLFMAFGCLAGVGVILVSEMIQAAPLIPTLLGVISGILYSGVVLCLMRMRDEDPAYLIAINHIVTFITLIPIAWLSGIQPSPFQCVALAAFGALQMGLPYLLFTKGIRHTPGHEATLVALLEPVLLPVWIFVAWRHAPDYEPPGPWTIFGASLILMGLLARTLWRDNRIIPVRKRTATKDTSPTENASPQAMPSPQAD